jgi:hypothetical protein
VGRAVFTVRTMGGVALLLFGWSYLWLTPGLALLGIDTSVFGTRGMDPTGVWWDSTRVLSVGTLVGFTVAAAGLFARARWWPGVALTSAGPGLLALVPYWIAVDAGGATTPWFNVAVHGLGCAGVVALLLVPPLRAWVDGHVGPGR